MKKRVETEREIPKEVRAEIEEEFGKDALKEKKKEGFKLGQTVVIDDPKRVFHGRTGVIVGIHPTTLSVQFESGARSLYSKDELKFPRGTKRKKVK